MVKELEIAAAGALAGLSGTHREPDHLGQPCANCGHVLSGRYCSSCGQSSDLRHRSLLHLVAEALEGRFHADGRLWRTLPALFFRPGTLGRDYLEGRVARHVPPFRMFLISLVVFIFAAEHAVGDARQGNGRAPVNLVIDKRAIGDPQQAAADIRKAATDDYAKAERAAADRRDAALRTPGAGGSANAAYQQAVQAAAARRAALMAAAESVQGRSGDSALSRRVRAALDNPQYFIVTLFGWAHRLAVLLLPLVAGYLALFYAYKKRFYIYDHLIIAMDFLSFLFLTFAVVFVTPSAVQSYAFLLACIWAPVNLFMTLRGAYGSSIAGAVIKSAAVSAATAFSFLMLVAGLVMLTIYQL